ncbi:MAG TPA: insulinase family protein, partial [Dissulfurispiraceae bacterium]|nr:insulinase family protein [Dissulfurispiraceae bacterium]
MSLRQKIVLLFFTVIVFLVPAGEGYSLDFARKTLPNGLVVYHSERHNLPVVMVSLLIKASPLDELPGKAGVASMTAHMMTEGTSTRSSLQISQEIEFIGADLDASATKDYSTLSLSVLKKNVQKGFEVLSDVLLNPAFPEEELKRKRELVK